MNVLRSCTNILIDRVNLLIEAYRTLGEASDHPFDFHDLLVAHGYTVRAVRLRQEGGDVSALSREEVAALNNCMVFCDPA